MHTDMRLLGTHFLVLEVQWSLHTNEVLHSQVVVVLRGMM